MEKVLTKKQIEKNERDKEVKSRFDELMAAGSSRTPVYELLADEFGISKTTVFYIVNGTRKERKSRKRKYRLRKSNH